MSKRKFKVGDRVIVNNKDKSYQGMAEVGDVGTVIKVDNHPNQPYFVKFDVKRFGYHDCDGECKNGYGYYCTERMLDLVNHKNETIVIYRKGQEVIALDKATGKKAVAKCSPDDEFDFNIGSKLAFDRLLGVEQPKEKKNITFRMLCIKDWDSFLGTKHAKKGQVYVFEEGRTKFLTKTSCVYSSFESFISNNVDAKECFIELKDGDDPQEIMKKYDEIKVGDIVKVIEAGKQFSTSHEWVKEHVPAFAHEYSYGNHLSQYDLKELVFNVLYIDSERAYIEAINWEPFDTPCFLIGIQGIKKA